VSITEFGTVYFGDITETGHKINYRLTEFGAVVILEFLPNMVGESSSTGSIVVESTSIIGDSCSSGEITINSSSQAVTLIGNSISSGSLLIDVDTEIIGLVGNSSSSGYLILILPFKTVTPILDCSNYIEVYLDTI
jgi:hypothetical protein